MIQKAKKLINVIQINETISIDKLVSGVYTIKMEQGGKVIYAGQFLKM